MVALLHEFGTERGEYLHLSRSFVAMISTLGSLYDGVPRRQVATDILITLNTFPARLLQDFLRSNRSDIRQAVNTLARRAVFAAPKARKPEAPLAAEANPVGRNRKNPVP